MGIEAKQTGRGAEQYLSNNVIVMNAASLEDKVAIAPGSAVRGAVENRLFSQPAFNEGF